MTFAMCRHMHPADDLPDIRARVIQIARDALSPADSSKFRQRQPVALDGRKAPEMTNLVSPAGIFRMVIEFARIDRMDPVAAESFMDVVQKRLEELERDPEGARRMCGGA
ncbi:MAG: hypothetical protein ACYC1I_11715 [Acidimicrobiales bacterium]